MYNFISIDLKLKESVKKTVNLITVQLSFCFAFGVPSECISDSKIIIDNVKCRKWVTSFRITPNLYRLMFDHCKITICAFKKRQKDLKKKKKMKRRISNLPLTVFAIDTGESWKQQLN